MPNRTAVRTQTRIAKPGVRTLREAAALLRAGGLVALPTETVYGLAANALDARACAGIFTAKRRPSNDPLIVHVADVAAAEQIAHLNPAARSLARKFWPGPLTLVLPKRACIPDLVTSGKRTVAIRIPAHPVFRDVLAACGLPLAAPSANPFGYVSPTTARHVRDGLADRVPLIIDGGPCSVGVESTIVDLSRPSRPRLLRPGGLPVETIERALGRRIARPRAPRASAVPDAPGMLPWHYSPSAPLKLVPHRALAAALAAAPAGTVWLAFSNRSAAQASVRGLALPSRPEGAARMLFAALRTLDARKPPLILAAEPPGKSGLWRAIRDRLVKAAARAGDLPPVHRSK